MWNNPSRRRQMSHLTDEQKNRLLARLQNKLEGVQSDINSSAAGTTMPALMLRHKREIELPAVQAALTRLMQNPEGFGTCTECKEKIPYGRLMSRPETIFCRLCLEDREEENPNFTRLS